MESSAWSSPSTGPCPAQPSSPTGEIQLVRFLELSCSAKVARLTFSLVVHLRNLLDNNGTSLHFHGIRQNGTSDMDGGESMERKKKSPPTLKPLTYIANAKTTKKTTITQCPTAPKSSMTYKW